MNRYFPKFSEVVDRFSFSQELLNLFNNLKSGIFETELKNIIHTNFGLFLYEQEHLIPIATHINTYKAYFNNKYGKNISFEDIDETHNDSEIMDTFHKVHFTECKTLSMAIYKNTDARFVGTLKSDGFFMYYVQKNNEIIFESNKQKLYMCKNCIQEIDNIYNKKFNINITASTIKDITQLQIDKIKSDFENCYQSNILPKHWNKISKIIREKNDWKCLNSTCPYKGINFKDNPKFLDVHHANMRQNDNRGINLIPLCKYCHANQPHHHHYKHTQLYTEFINKFCTSSKASV